MLRLWKGKRCLSVSFLISLSVCPLILSILSPSFRIMSRGSLKCPRRVFCTSKAIQVILIMIPADGKFLLSLHARWAVWKCCDPTVWLLMFFFYHYIVLSLHKLQINKCLLKLNTISHHYEYVTFSCRKSWVCTIMVWRETKEFLVVGCINLTFIEENKW